MLSLSGLAGDKTSSKVPVGGASIEGPRFDRIGFEKRLFAFSKPEEMRVIYYVKQVNYKEQNE